MKNYLLLLRPKQWLKNLFVFAALIFSKEFLHVNQVIITIQALIILCIVSSIVYIINDIVDKDNDKLHPVKCKRPIACGAITINAAIFLAGVLFLFGFSWAYYLSKSFMLILALYLLLNIAYSLKLKNVVIIDVMIIASGFVIRVVSGALILNVKISPWLIVCTSLLALFISLAKRRNELIILEAGAANHRRILEDYSMHFLDLLITMIAGMTIMAYTLYSFLASTNSEMMLTVPFVLYGVLRYLFLVFHKGIGGSPERLVLEDKHLFINLILWSLTVPIILISY